MLLPSRVCILVLGVSREYFFNPLLLLLTQLRQFSEKIDNLKFFRAVFDRKLFDGET